MRAKVFLIILALVSVCVFSAACAEEALNCGETAEILLTAARNYNPGLTEKDLLSDCSSHSFDAAQAASRAEALVMLSRAFGDLPELTGDNARTAIPAQTFTDVPEWAADVIGDVTAAGIVAGDGNGLLLADDTFTEAELRTLIRRVYALEGIRPQDDFYAAVNREWLAESVIPAGLTINGQFYGLTLDIQEQIADLIADIAANPQEKGSPEAKIKALYDCVMDTENREKEGVAPLQKYLDAMEKAESLDELMENELTMRHELGFCTLIGFGLGTDSEQSDQYIVTFSPLSAAMDKAFFASSEQQTDAYRHYTETLLALSGLDAERAKHDADMLYETEKMLAEACMDVQEYGDVDKTNNIYTLDALSALYPHIHLSELYDASGLQPTDRIRVADSGLLEAGAALMDNEHLDLLRVMARRNLLLAIAGTLSDGFTEASYEFSEQAFGINSRMSTEMLASMQVTTLLSTYLSQAYVKSFPQEAKADVEKMVREFIAIYRERILSLDWMSEETREKAVRKLDTMQIKVGYPDKWDDTLDAVDILSPEEGGTFFSNAIALSKAQTAKLISRQMTGVDKTEWIIMPYTVNACYDSGKNDITFPAAVLQPPLYDVNASQEENLGGIGYLIAHEITHAFDNNGAKYDEYGNACDWWTDADYEAFQKLCEKVIAWYNGVEAYPGIVCNGTLTLSENVADLGSMSCLIATAALDGNADYDMLFRASARTWASTTTRPVREYLSAIDVHSPDKLRCNRVLQAFDEFYKTYDIQPEDGMWTNPEDRPSIW